MTTTAEFFAATDCPLKQQLRKDFLKVNPEFNRDAPKLLAVCHRLLDNLSDHTEQLPSYEEVKHDLETLEASLERLRAENETH